MSTVVIAGRFWRLDDDRVYHDRHLEWGFLGQMVTACGFDARGGVLLHVDLANRVARPCQRCFPEKCLAAPYFTISRETVDGTS